MLEDQGARLVGERSVEQGSGGEPPEDWTAIGTAGPWGHLSLSIRQAVPDVTAFELEMATAPPPALGSLQDDKAVARVKALRKARGGRPDLPENDWQRCVQLVRPTLSELDAGEILAAIAALRPHEDHETADGRPGLSAEAVAALTTRKRGRPGWTRGLFERRLEEADRLTSEPKTNAKVADNFLALDGITRLIDPDYLSTLKRRHRRGQLPE